ncbi:hypothetical protein G9A89_013776 [Geosiphon pyriformis]|nr:hypothetical protein G9A89_013776 [Geosiphon pyriformis]
MTIVIRNTQCFVRLPIGRLKHELRQILLFAKLPDWDVGVHLAGDRYVKYLNLRYRKTNKPTDILSFPFQPALSPGILPLPDTADDKNLGDLVISMAYVQRWCKRYKETINSRMPVLLTHGICHLLGYDHETNDDWEQMSLRENEILDQFWEWKKNHSQHKEKDQKEFQTIT